MSGRADDEGQKPEHPSLPSREEQMLHHVVAAMSMVHGLPAFAHDGRADVPPVVRVACHESFFMNVRLIAELLTRNPQVRDFGAGSAREARAGKPDRTAPSRRTQRSAGTHSGRPAPSLVVLTRQVGQAGDGWLVPAGGVGSVVVVLV